MRPTSFALAGFLLLAVLSGPNRASAQEEPFQLSFVGPVMQLVDDDADVKGVRINLIYGVNRNVTGFDLGLINRTTRDFKGLQHGLVGVTHGTFTGWQDNFIANIAEGELYGLQTGMVNMTGVGEGVQWGLYNSANRLEGLQVAVVNFAQDLHGIQVGLINIIRSKSRFPILPIVNWKFDE